MPRLPTEKCELDELNFPEWGWPEGYPLYYLLADGAVLCPQCARRENGSEASVFSDDPHWRLVAYDVHWEGEPLPCDHCANYIESAYGEPENDDAD